MLVDIGKWWIVWNLLDWAKLSLAGDTSLGVVAMGACAWLWAWWKQWPFVWRHRAQGVLFASVLIGCVSASDFLYQRWSTDPRSISASEVDLFVAALPPYDKTQILTVFCFPDDPSSCAIAGRYQDWFADHWSLQPGPQYETSADYHPDLSNRIWIYTQFTHDRPTGAIALHKALQDMGMNPGYRLNSEMGPNKFGFAVGRSR
jgi:hypothetical protein